MLSDTCIERVEVCAYRMPIDPPESDATLMWDHVPLVVVHVRAGGLAGLGYSYASAAAARLIDDTLADVVRGSDAFAVRRSWRAMLGRVRNIGRSGVAAYAIAAVDAALWDLAARLLGCSLAQLLGRARDAVPLYASGGFTSMPINALERQVGDWVAGGFTRVKMKVGREPDQDPERVAAARAAIGDAAQLFVDANNGYTRAQALAMATQFVAHRVTWFEEPLASNDLAGHRLLRRQAPPGLAIAAGEYGCELREFCRMLDANAVDVLQADGTRALGITGLLRVDSLCSAHDIPLSLHTAPAYHLHVGAALDSLVHAEWFADHVQIEQALFEGAPQARDGNMHVEPGTIGNGLRLRSREAARHAI